MLSTTVIRRLPYPRTALAPTIPGVDDAAQPHGADGRPPWSALLLRTARLDDLDRALVELLQADGRRPYAQLAAELGVTEKTARRRVQALVDGGVIQITAVTDPALLGYRAAALLGIEVDGTRSAAEIALDLTALPTVDYVVVAAGRYPLYAELICTDRAELLRVIEGEVRRTPGIRAVEPFLYLSFHYQHPHLAAARAKRRDAPEGVRPVALDPLDRSIIRALSEDGRAPLQQIADGLGVGESLVRTRLRHLTASGVARVLAIVNPLGLGYATTAWLAIRVRPGVRLTDVAEALARLPYVTYVMICAGRVDIFAEVVCATEAELLQLLDDEIRPLDGLAGIEVAVYLDLHYKRLVPILSTEAGEAPPRAGPAGRPDRPVP